MIIYKRVISQLLFKFWFQGNVLNKVPEPVAIAEFAHYVKELKTGDNGGFQKQYDVSEIDKN